MRAVSSSSSEHRGEGQHAPVMDSAGSRSASPWRTGDRWPVSVKEGAANPLRWEKVEAGSGGPPRRRWQDSELVRKAARRIELAHVVHT